MSYIRKKTYSVDEILKMFDNIKKDTTRKFNKYLPFNLDGDIINPSSRYRTFKEKGVECVSCGLTGEFFAKERFNDGNEKFHLNLYGLRNGREIMLTKDHIMPKAKGGANSIKNYQTMCGPCNVKKGDCYE